MCPPPLPRTEPQMTDSNANLFQTTLTNTPRWNAHQLPEYALTKSGWHTIWIGGNCPLWHRGNVLSSLCGAQMVPLASVLMRHLFLSLWFWPILLYIKYFQTVLSLDPHLIQSVNLCFLIGVLVPFLNLPYCYFFLFIHLFFAPYFHVPSLCLY